VVRALIRLHKQHSSAPLSPKQAARHLQFVLQHHELLSLEAITLQTHFLVRTDNGQLAAAGCVYMGLPSDFAQVQSYVCGTMVFAHAEVRCGVGQEAYQLPSLG
jgi:hypothetical protein